MALLFFDGFETYGTVGAMAPTGAWCRRWARMFPGTDDPAIIGAAAGKAVQLVPNSSARTFPLTDDTTLIFGCAFRIVGTCADGTILFRLWDAKHDGYASLPLEGSSGVGVAWGTGGELKIVLTDYTQYPVVDVVLGVTSGLSLVIGDWHYLELKVLIGDEEAGAFDLHLDGASVLSDASCKTRSASWATAYDSVQLAAPPENIVFEFDNLYVCDSTGGANNDFLGVVRVTALSPSGDAGTNQWTPESGTDHSAMVDDGATDDEDATYLEDEVSGHVELWTHGALGSVGTIFGVQISTDVRITGADAFSLKTLAQLGSGTVSEGEARLVVSTDYVTHVRLMEKDPDGSDAWTPVSVNSSKFGVKVE